MAPVISGKFHDRRDRRCNRQGKTNASADTSGESSNYIEKAGQGRIFAAENVALSYLSAFHDQGQPSSDVTYVDNVHNHINVESNAAAKKVLNHRGWRREFISMSTN